MSFRKFSKFNLYRNLLRIREREVSAALPNQEYTAQYAVAVSFRSLPYSYCSTLQTTSLGLNGNNFASPSANSPSRSIVSPLHSESSYKQVGDGSFSGFSESVKCNDNLIRLRERLFQLFGVFVGIALGYSARLCFRLSGPDQPSTSKHGGQRRLLAAGLMGVLGKDEKKGNVDKSVKDGERCKECGRYRARNNMLADVVEQVNPSVVVLQLHDVRRRWRESSVNQGSGFIVDNEGHILTNAHVVLNNPHTTRLVVQLSDGRQFEAVIVEVDANMDLALIKIQVPDGGVKPAVLGESSTLRLGEYVVAVGAPLGFTNSVTAGVVSCVERSARDLGLGAHNNMYIQTDATVTHGNSGGPLVNLDGEVIGINSLTATPGISFAIPIDSAKKFLATAKANTKKRTDKRGSEVQRRQRLAYIGMTTLTLTNEIIHDLRNRMGHHVPNEVTHGILVWRVVVGSPSYHAGLQPGDIIVSVNGHTIHSIRDLNSLLEQPADLTMVVIRGSNRYSVTVTPEP